MLKIAKERILERLNNFSRSALQGASESCISRGHYEVTVSHLLLAMLDQPGGDVARLLPRLSLRSEELKPKLGRALDQARQGAQDLPEFASLLLELLQDSLILGNGELGEQDIRTGAIFAAIAANPDKYCHFFVFSDFKDVDARALINGFATLTAGSMEGPIEQGQASGAQSEASLTPAESALSKYGRNLTEAAAAGNIDPVFCRDAEIAQMTDILSRRRKNNPILVGDPGVGKTALAEGLALKIEEGDVPPALADVTLWELDLGALQAGASVKGEFERRLKSVIEEATNATEKVVLFIDEAHVLIGGGGQAGGSDAANLLKPALARGELRAIAATTWSEYKKYFEKDAALARRFQLVSLDEPSVEDCVTILRGLRSRYEETHNVYISDAALRAAAALSARYLTGRQLPDKALDVLDTASVRVSAGLTTKPRALDSLARRIAMRKQERADRLRDSQNLADGHSADLTFLDEALARDEAEYARFDVAWQAEKADAEEVIELRLRLGNPVDEEDEPTDLDKLRDELAEKLHALRDKRDNGQALVSFEVGEGIVADVISEWTGIPASAMSGDDASKLLDLGEKLKSEIRGQDDALDIIHDRLKTSRLDLVRENTPRGVFLLVGSSGVGKTETAEQVACHLFGGRQFLTVINMSEYQEKHALSRLIGSPPGYVGFGEGGVLTEAIRKKPYSVVLLDEVEKAHPDILNLFLQAFDKGVINDGEGREIDCKNIVFFLTSNQGSEALMQNRETVASASQEALEKAIRPYLQEHFKPAILARMRILCFRPLESETMRDIIGLKLKSCATRLGQTRSMQMSWDDSLIDAIEARATHAENGARMIDQVIERMVLPAIANETLERIGRTEPLEAVEISAAEGGFLMRFLPEIATPQDDQNGCADNVAPVDLENV